MAQLLRALPPLQEEPSSTPSTTSGSQAPTFLVTVFNTLADLCVEQALPLKLN